MEFLPPVEVTCFLNSIILFIYASGMEFLPSVEVTGFLRSIILNRLAGSWISTQPVSQQANKSMDGIKIASKDRSRFLG